MTRMPSSNGAPCGSRDLRCGASDPAPPAYPDPTGIAPFWRQFGTERSEHAVSLAPDKAGGAYIAGHTSGDLAAPNTGTWTWDAWLAHYDSTGTRTWIRQFGTDRTELVGAVSADAAGNTFLCGTTQGDLAGPNAGGADSWVGRFGPSCYANCNERTAEPILSVDDFTCFINAFAAGMALQYEEQVTSYANCDGSTTTPVLNVGDFTCFIDAFAQGCP